MQPEQKIDGKAIMMLAKRASRDKFEACGLVTVSDQLKLAHVVSAAADMDDSKLNCMVTAVVKRKKPSKVQLSQLSEVNRRIYKAK